MGIHTLLSHQRQVAASYHSFSFHSAVQNSSRQAWTREEDLFSGFSWRHTISQPLLFIRVLYLVPCLLGLSVLEKQCFSLLSWRGKQKHCCTVYSLGIPTLTPPGSHAKCLIFSLIGFQEWFAIIADRIPWEAGFYRKCSTQVYWDWFQHVWWGEENAIWDRERFSCDSVTARASADPMESSKAGKAV